MLRVLGSVKSAVIQWWIDINGRSLERTWMRQRSRPFFLFHPQNLCSIVTDRHDILMTISAMFPIQLNQEFRVLVKTYKYSKFSSSQEQLLPGITQ